MVEYIQNGVELLPCLSFMTGVYRPQAALGTIVPDHLVPEMGVLMVDCDSPPPSGPHAKGLGELHLCPLPVQTLKHF